MSDGRRRRIVVLGLGNTLNRDEGVGVHLLNRLREQLGTHTPAEFVDGGTLGLNLLPLVEECSHLVLLDAVNAGKPPGTVVELAREEIPLFAGVKLSQHQLTFQEVLGLAQVRGKLPEHLHLVGIQPADTDVGYGLTSGVEAVLQDAGRRVEGVLRRWGLWQDEPVGRK
jgi:hydrogenase maturation protease